VVVTTPILLLHDMDIVVWVSRHRLPSLDIFFLYFTMFGNYVFALGEALYIALFHRRKEKFRANIAILISYVSWLVSGRVVVCLKNIFMRPRPYVYNPDVGLIYEKPQDCSFPSGHSSTALSLTYPLIIEWRSRGARILLIAYAALMCFSRVYCGVHYPTDVLWGSLIGLLVSHMIYVFIWTRIGEKQGLRGV